MSQVHELTNECRVSYSLTEPPSCTCGWSTSLDLLPKEIEVIDTEAEADLAELRDAVANYQSRLEKAVIHLVDIRDTQHGDEWQRLNGKIEGIKVALSYLREAPRG